MFPPNLADMLYAANKADMHQRALDADRRRHALEAEQARLAAEVRETRHRRAAPAVLRRRRHWPHWLTPSLRRAATPSGGTARGR